MAPGVEQVRVASTLLPLWEKENCGAAQMSRTVTVTEVLGPSVPSELRAVRVSVAWPAATGVMATAPPVAGEVTVKMPVLPETAATRL